MRLNIAVLKQPDSAEMEKNLNQMSLALKTIPEHQVKMLSTADKFIGLLNLANQVKLGF